MKEQLVNDLIIAVFFHTFYVVFVWCAVYIMVEFVRLQMTFVCFVVNNANGWILIKENMDLESITLVLVLCLVSPD